MRFRLLNIEDARDHLLTGFLLLFAIILMVIRHDGALSNLRAASIAVFSYLESPLGNVRVYRKALQTNVNLQRQNVLLQDELSRLRSVSAENRALRNMIGFKERNRFDLAPVTIIGKNLTGVNNSLTVDAGQEEGIETGMALVTGDGLAGRVILSSGKFAMVMPYYNMLFRASARVQGLRAYGVVSWTGNTLEYLIMQYVPQSMKVEAGMVVETSGFSNEFPPHIPIGTVIKAEPEPGKDTQLIYLRPFVNLFEVSEGFIIKSRSDTALARIQTAYGKQF